MGTARRFHFAAAAGLLAHLLFSALPLAAQAREADEKAILKQLEALRLADLGGDVTAMAPLLDDELHNRNHYGNESTKPQRLELFKTYKPSQLSFEQVQVRFLGDSMAAVNGLKRESDGGGTRAVTFTHVWRKHADG